MVFSEGVGKNMVALEDEEEVFMSWRCEIVMKSRSWPHNSGMDGKNKWRMKDEGQ